MFILGRELSRSGHQDVRVKSILKVINYSMVLKLAGSVVNRQLPIYEDFTINTIACMQCANYNNV